jgi:predicted nucleic acid-binding protein
MTVLDGLLDTNIFIDILRGHKPAIEWMTSNPHLAFAIPSIVRMEIVLGAQNKIEQEKLVKQLKAFPLVFPSEADSQWAMEQFEIYYLSHQVEILDCFIAAISVRLQLPIFTRNVKHLSVFQGVAAHIPY